MFWWNHASSVIPASLWDSEEAARPKPISAKARAFCSGEDVSPAPSCPFGDAKPSPPLVEVTGAAPTLPTAPTFASSARAQWLRHTTAKPTSDALIKVESSSRRAQYMRGGGASYKVF